MPDIIGEIITVDKRGGAASLPQSDPKIAHPRFAGRVAQEPTDGMLWEAGAKTKWNRVRPRQKSYELK